MKYDWSGVRTRRIAIFKRTTFVFISFCLPVSLGLWLHYLQ